MRMHYCGDGEVDDAMQMRGSTVVPSGAISLCRTVRCTVMFNLKEKREKE
jgi:hypothetical protein